eukprot:s312_g2.t1
MSPRPLAKGWPQDHASWVGPGVVVCVERDRPVPQRVFVRLRGKVKAYPLEKIRLATTEEMVDGEAAASQDQEAVIEEGAHSSSSSSSSDYPETRREMAERAKLLDDLPVSVKRTLADRRVAAEEEAMDPHTLDFKKKQKLFESLAKSLSPPTVMQEAQLRHQMEQTYARGEPGALRQQERVVAAAEVVIDTGDYLKPGELDVLINDTMGHWTLWSSPSPQAEVKELLEVSAKVIAEDHQGITEVTTGKARIEYRWSGLDDEWRRAYVEPLKKAVGVYLEHSGIKGVPLGQMVDPSRARWIFGGHKDPDAGLYPTSSPTASVLGHNLLNFVAVQKGWTVHYEDVSAAFLQGKDLPRAEKIYVKVPSGYPSEVTECLLAGLGQDMRPDIVELTKAGFGLPESPRLWYLEYRDTIQDLGLMELVLVPGLFRAFNGRGELRAMASLHVDDARYAGDETSDVLWEQLHKVLKFGKLRKATDGWQKFCGRWERQSPDTKEMEYSMTEYTKNIPRPRGGAQSSDGSDDVLGYIDDVVTGDDKVDELTEADRKVIGSLVGQLNRAARQSRYDLCYVASLVQQLAGRGKLEALKWLDHGVRRAQEDIVFKVRNLGCDLSDLLVVSVSDAAFGAMPGGASQGGIMVLFASPAILEGPGPVCALEGTSNKIHRIVRCSMSAEVCASRCHFLVTDARTGYDALSAETLPSDRKIAIDVGVLRQGLLDGETNSYVRWVPGSHMPCDGFTKWNHNKKLVELMVTREWKNMRDTKLQAIELRMAQLRDVWRRKQQAQEAYDQAEPGFGIRFARRLVNNLSLELSKVDVSFSSLNPAAVGAAKMNSLQVLSTDSSFRRFKQDEVLEAKGTSLYKILSFDGLSLAYGQSMEALANLVSPVRAELKLGHVPDDGLLRLEVDLGTDKPTEIHTKRSQLIGVLALKTALSKKWEQLRKLLVDPKEEERLKARLDDSEDKYFKLFRQQCLANVDVTEEKVVAALYQTGLNCSQLEQPEQEELETLETVLPVQRLASARCRAEDFITELVKKAKPQEKKSGGWFSRTFFGHKEPEESSLDKLSVEDLLTELQSAADVEVVEPPQKLVVQLCGGGVLMDIQDDTAVEVMQLLSLDLSTTSLAVNVESATDHKGQNSAAFSLFLALGSVNVSHQQKSFFRPKQVGSSDEIMQQALDLRLENKLEPTQNLLEVSLTFAPLEIFMIPGLVASILGFYPDAAEVEEAAGVCAPVVMKTIEAFVEEKEMKTTRAERLKSVLDANADRAKELAQEVYNRIPDRISLAINLSAPTVHVPVASVGKAVITLGQLTLETPEPCLFECLQFELQLKNTQVSTVFATGDVFDVVEPLPITISLKYAETPKDVSIVVAIKIGHLSLSASPNSVNLLMGLPQAVVDMLTVPITVRQKKPAALEKAAEPVPVQKELKRAGSAVGFSATEVLGEDFVAFKRAEELQKKPMRTSVSLAFDDATFSLSDSIMPLMRLKMEAMPPGLQVSVESGKVDVKLMESSLSIDVLNTRHGDWEPFLERFDFGVSVVMSETMRISLHALGPLHLNLVPKPTRQILELLPLLLTSLRPPQSSAEAEKKPDESSSGKDSDSQKLRVVSLWGGQLEVLCIGARNAEAKVVIQPTGSQWVALDDKISALTLRSLRVRVLGSEKLSEPLWFEQNAAVVVPDCAGRVVAQLLTPQPDHRLLLLAPALRLHNETDLMLAVRFHEEARATVIKHLDSAICSASLLGLKSECEPAAAAPQAANYKSADNEWVCLPPNSICAVPAAATAQDGKSGDRTIISLRPAAWGLPDVDFSQPSSVGRKTVEGLSCKLGVGSSKSGYPHAGPVPLHFLVVQGSEDIGSGNGQKIKTLSIRPSMVFMNALPFGPLGLDIASTSSKAPPVVVEALQRVNFYGLSMQEMRGGLTLAAQLAPKAPFSGKVNLEGNDIVDITENVLGDEAKILDMRESTSGAPAAVSLECLGHGQIRVSCSHWLLDRSGAQEKGLGKLEVFYQGAKLPSHNGITLLHAGCFENPCDLGFCPDGKSMKAKQTMKLPPNFESFVWNTPSGSLEMTLRIGSIKSSSVHGATCMQFTLAPRLVLTNASDVELELETPDKMKIRWKPRESRVLHWKANTEAVDPLATTFRFRPIGGGQCEFSGVVLCSDGSAGSTPFTLKRQAGGVEVWSVDVAPLHGSMGVLIRPGSDFIACNFLENRMEVQDEERPDERINVPAGGESVPIGWCKPFSGKRSRAVRVIVDKEIVDIPDLQRTAVRPLKTPGLALRVMRSGKTTKLSLEELQEKQQVQAKSEAFQATFELHVKLGRAGISLIDESPPQPCELFFFSLDMLRLEYMQDAARDSEKITVSVSEVQGICQLPDRTNDLDKVSMLDPSQLQRLHENLLQNQELPAVILANHSAGGKSFLQFQMTRQATSSRDLLLSAAQLDVDKLDFTVDEKWLTPLQQWLSHTFGAGGFDLFGVVAEELLNVAGKPITDGYIPPEVPAVVQAEDVNISAVDTTVWCSLRLKYLEFLPVYVRTALKVLSFSSYFTLDGVGLLLPARHLEPHRGSLQDYAMAVVSDYGTSILAHLGSLLGKSSLLNLPKAPLKLGGAVVAVMGDKLTDVTTGAASLLRNFTMDDEYIAKNREKKTITGASQGFAAAGKTLMDGVEGMFDVVKKPVEGAQKEGLWGFATGLTKGVAGSIVKPVAAFGTAIGEVGTGLASTTNTLNDNEANQRRRARRRLRLPRLLFGELGEVRPFVDFEAQLYQRYGANVRGVCEVVLLDREEKGGDLFITSLLLFVDQLAVAVASNQAADVVPNKFERTFNILKKTDSSKVAPLRGLRFSQLQKVALEGRILKLVGSAKEVFSLDLDKANLSEAALRALLSGLEAAAANGRLEAHRTWSQLRAVRQNDEHSARVRDMKLAAETGLKMLKSEAAMRDRGAARSRLLEVWEVERHVFGWGTCSWPTDGDLQWRWVGPNGRKHPQVDEKLSKDVATAAKEPPCQLGGLYKAVGPWQVETTAATDKDGWVYGMAWSQPEWNKKPGLADVLRRRRRSLPCGGSVLRSDELDVNEMLGRVDSCSPSIPGGILCALLSTQGQSLEDKLHQEFYNVPTKDLPPRMQPRQLPNLQDAMKIDWDDWKSWEWMQPGWKGVKMHSQCVINADGSAEIRSVWK